MMDKRERIFKATEELLATQGFHGISMSLVAKEAGVAAGTIYRYFSDKDDLLRQLHLHVSLRARDAVFEGVSPDAAPFEQYRQVWLNAFRLLTTDTFCLRCKAQYESSPHFEQMELDPENQQIWLRLQHFFEEGVRQGLFIALPHRVLSALSLDSVMHIAQLDRLAGHALSEAEREEAVHASWRAILKPQS